MLNDVWFALAIIGAIIILARFAIFVYDIRNYVVLFVAVWIIASIYSKDKEDEQDTH